MAEVQLAAVAAEAREAIDNEDLDRAARACLRALQRFPRWVDGYWLLGQVLVEREYAAQARACFEAVASAQPDEPRAYEGLAAAAEQRKDLDTAIAGLVRAIEVGETSQGVLDELQHLLRQSERPPGEVASNARAAHTRLLEGRYEAADLAAERALLDEPNRLDLLLVQAVARLLGDDRGGAQRRSEQLLDLSPDCMKALAILRYLNPGERGARYEAELGALDPERRTLVWLRSQLTARGLDPGELPGEPRVITWTEVPGETAVAAGRPLDRLIPELEQVLPQWLRDAAQAAPSESAAIAPPVTPEEPALEGAMPSVLGDVESLAREFEEAMQVPASSKEPETPAAGTPAAAHGAPPVAEPESAKQAGPVPGSEGGLARPPAEQPPEAAERPAEAQPEQAGERAINVAASAAQAVTPDEFAAWSGTPAAPVPAEAGAKLEEKEPTAEAETPALREGETAPAPPHEETATGMPPSEEASEKSGPPAEDWSAAPWATTGQQTAPQETAASKAEPVAAGEAVASWAAAAPEEQAAEAPVAADKTEAVNAAMLVAPERPAESRPPEPARSTGAAEPAAWVAGPAAGAGQQNRQEALAAAREGDYLGAVARLGEALAKLRATSSGR